MNILKDNPWRAVIIFPVISFILCAVISQVVPQFPVISDSADYDTLALRILDDPRSISMPIDETVQPPLYPLLLAGVYSFFGHTYSAVYAIQFIFVGLIAAFMFIVARAYLKISFRSALVVALCILGWPYFILFSLLLRTEVLFIFLTLWSALLFLRFVETEVKQYVFASGLVLGLATLARPVTLLLPIWLGGSILLLLFLFRREEYRKRMQNIIVYTGIAFVGFMLVVGPWIAYVSYHNQSFIPVSGNARAVLEKGNVTFEYLEDSELERTGETSFVDLLRVKSMNVFLFWNPGAGGYRAERIYEIYPIASVGIWLYRIAFFLLLIGAAYALYRHENRYVILSGVIIAYFWAVHVVTFPYPRYMLPTVPFVIVLALYTFDTYVLPAIKERGKISR